MKKLQQKDLRDDDNINENHYVQMFFAKKSHIKNK